MGDQYNTITYDHQPVLYIGWCPRCEKSHDKIVASPLRTRMNDSITHVVVCPTYDVPVLLSVKITAV